MTDKRLGRYGVIGEPEVRRGVRHVADDIHVVRSTYAMYREIVSAFLKESDDLYDRMRLPRRLYGEAVRLLEDRRGMRPEGEKVLEAVREMSRGSKGSEYAGMYLSALLNETGMERLVVRDIHLHVGGIGYRLREGKLLVMGKSVQAYHVGEECEGIVMNFGAANNVAPFARKGFQGNWWEGYTFLGNYTRGGVQVNMGRADTIGDYAKKCVQVNFGGCQRMGWCAKGGVQISHGYADEFAAGAEGGVQATYGAVWQIGTSASGGVQMDCGKGKVRKYMDMGKDRNLSRLAAGLGRKAREVEFLKKIKEPSDEAIEKVLGFDFAAFENEMIGMGEEIEEYVRSKYGR